MTTRAIIRTGIEWLRARPWLAPTGMADWLETRSEASLEALIWACPDASWIAFAFAQFKEHLAPEARAELTAWGLRCAQRALSVHAPEALLAAAACHPSDSHRERLMAHAEMLARLGGWGASAAEWLPIAEAARAETRAAAKVGSSVAQGATAYVACWAKDAAEAACAAADLAANGYWYSAALYALEAADRRAEAATEIAEDVARTRTTHAITSAPMDHCGRAQARADLAAEREAAAAMRCEEREQQLASLLASVRWEWVEGALIRAGLLAPHGTLLPEHAQ